MVMVPCERIRGRSPSSPVGVGSTFPSVMHLLALATRAVTLISRMTTSFDVRCSDALLFSLSAEDNVDVDVEVRVLRFRLRWRYAQADIKIVETTDAVMGSRFFGAGAMMLSLGLGRGGGKAKP